MPQVKNTHSFIIKSMRLQGWDYGNNGAYFLTFNTKNRIHHFGEIQMNENGNRFMQLNSNGLIAEKIWESIPQQFPYAELANFVVMPDHFHGVIFIDNMRFQEDEKEVNEDNLENQYRRMYRK